MDHLVKLDALDYRIIYLLSEDGRMDCAEMARRLGQSARTIRYRLNRLIKNQVLQVSAIVEPAAFGYTVRADVVIETEPGQVLNVARAAAQLEQVSYAACSTGDRDVSIQVLAHDADELYHFVADVVHNIPGVRRTQTHLLPLRIKDVHQWRPPEPSSRALALEGA